MARHQPPDVRRAQIFQAAMEVCAEKGIRDTRVDDIAARAGLSKGAVYHHFPSKQDIFLGIVELYVDQAHEKIEQLGAGGASVSRVFEELFRDMLAEIEENPRLVRSLIDFYLQSARDEAFRERFLAYYDAIIAEAARLLRRGVEEGELAPDIDADEVARLFVIGGDGIIFMYVALDDFERAAATIRTFNDLFLRAIARRGDRS